MASSPSFVVAAAGLVFEARIAGRLPAVRACCGRGSGFTAALEVAAGAGCGGIVSFGIAGGLDPALRPGALLIAANVIGPAGRFAADIAWSHAFAQALPAAILAPLLSLDVAAIDPAAKAQLFRDTGAAGVDMESHIAAGVAARRGLPFAALRAVADPADRRVPQAAIAGLRADGRSDALAVLKSLLRNPGELGGLVGVARNAATARAALARAARRLGKGFGLPGLV